MAFKTLFDIKKSFRSRLSSIYDINETDNIFNLILQDIFNYSRIDQLNHSQDPLSEDKVLQIEAILSRLLANEPIQYILGYSTFYNLIFKVNKNVLIPRQETELLVDLIIRKLHSPEIRKIIDIGTGSGCIAISIKKFLSQPNVLALDISEEAIDVAKQNAALNNTDIEFICADILNFSMKDNETFDMVVSNPPYIRDSEQKLMHNNVLDFEPHSALFVSEENPLIFYKAIADFCKLHLNKSGILALEINEALGNETKTLLEANSFSQVEIIKDLNYKDRIITARKI